MVAFVMASVLSVNKSNGEDGMMEDWKVGRSWRSRKRWKKAKERGRRWKNVGSDELGWVRFASDSFGWVRMARECRLYRKDAKRAEKTGNFLPRRTRSTQA